MQTMIHKLLLCTATLLIAACSSVPESFSQLKWQDQRGDRGLQVMQRDMAWCLDAIETRRSLQEQCMHERGWMLAK
jgi:starvation-inducible outer membrane lipoprotein